MGLFWRWPTILWVYDVHVENANVTLSRLLYNTCSIFSDDSYNCDRRLKKI